MSREMIDPWRQYGVKLEKEEMNRWGTPSIHLCPDCF